MNPKHRGKPRPKDDLEFQSLLRIFSAHRARDLRPCDPGLIETAGCNREPLTELLTSFRRIPKIDIE